MIKKKFKETKSLQSGKHKKIARINLQKQFSVEKMDKSFKHDRVSLRIIEGSEEKLSFFSLEYITSEGEQNNSVIKKDKNLIRKQQFFAFQFYQNIFKKFLLVRHLQIRRNF